MPRPTFRPSAPATALAVLAGLLAASCASDGGTSSPGSTYPSRDGTTTTANTRREVPKGQGVKAGWMDLRRRTRTGAFNSLTLLAASSEEGRLISSGRATMDGGKVIDDEKASLVVESYRRAGFERFAVQRSPIEGPPGALGVVWLDRGNGFESLFLMPGARGDPATRDLPDVYDGLKKLIFSIHQVTPGSTVVTGRGWSGDSFFRQRQEKGDR